MAGEDDGTQDDLDPKNQPGQGGESEGTQDELDELEPDLEGAAEQSDAEGDGEQGELEDEPKPKTRREARIARLAEDRVRERERADRLEREINTLRAETAAHRGQETEAQEQARLALMSPEERMDYKLAKADRLARMREQRAATATAEMLDQSRFEAKAAVSPLYARMQEEVEAEFQRLKAAGQYADREVIMKYKLGERVVNNAAKKGPKAAAAGKARIDRERVPPSNGRGSVAQGRTKQVDDREARRKRLENVTF